MVRAVVMAQTAAGRSEDVRDQVLGFEGIVEAHVVAGEYDLIVEVDGEEVNDVLHAASTEIQRVDGVLETKTYVALG